MPGMRRAFNSPGEGRAVVFLSLLCYCIRAGTPAPFVVSACLWLCSGLPRPPLRFLPRPSVLQSPLTQAQCSAECRDFTSGAEWLLFLSGCPEALQPPDPLVYQVLDSGRDP